MQGNIIDQALGNGPNALIKTFMQRKRGQATFCATHLVNPDEGNLVLHVHRLTMCVFSCWMSALRNDILFTGAELMKGLNFHKLLDGRNGTW